MTLDVTSGARALRYRSVLAVTLSDPTARSGDRADLSGRAHLVAAHDGRAEQQLAAEGIEAAEHTNVGWCVRVDSLCDRRDRPAVLDSSVDICAEPVRDVPKLLTIEGVNEDRLRIHLVAFF